MDEVAELAMVRVALVREGTLRYAVRGAEDAVRLARWLLGDRDRETLLVLCLDVKLVVNVRYVAAVGSLVYCPVHPREVFTAALLCKAASVILGHNHPSGDPTPSSEDCAITRRLVDAGGPRHPRAGPRQRCPRPDVQLPRGRGHAASTHPRPPIKVEDPWLMTDGRKLSAGSLALGACLAARGHRSPANRELDFEHEVIVCDHVVKAAVAANAASVVIAHNHPSGDPTPSPEDRAMTRRLSRAGELPASPCRTT